MHSTMGSKDQRAAAAWFVGAMLLAGAALPLQVRLQNPLKPCQR